MALIGVPFTLCADEPSTWLAHPEVLTGYAFGLAEFGSDVAHDLIWFKARALQSFRSDDPDIHTGWAWGPELNFGWQIDPDQAVIGTIGLYVRHAWQVGKVQPFVELSSGPGATDMGLPDASIAFTIATQGGGGLDIPLDDSGTRALKLAVDYIHASNADLKKPNGGLNAVLIQVGWTWSY